MQSTHYRTRQLYLKYLNIYNNNNIRICAFKYVIHVLQLTIIAFRMNLIGYDIATAYYK